MKKQFFSLVAAVFALVLFTTPSTTLAAPEDWETNLLIRERAQFFNNYDLNDDTDDNNAAHGNRWELNTLGSLTAKRKFNDNLTLNLNAKFIDITEEHWGGPTDHFSQSDLYQGNLEYKAGSVNAVLGRQQLVYGDQRLLGHLGWKDVSRSFDGGKFVFKNDNFQLDIFAVRPADIVSMGTAPAGTSSGESLVTSEDIRLVGLYSTVKFAEKSGVDIYHINWTVSDSATAAAGRDVDTCGFRVFFNESGVDGSAEYVVQTGDWSPTMDQDASAMAVKLGYTAGESTKVRFGVEYNNGSGDDGKDADKHKTFVFPFHTNHMHYGEMDLFSWGNMEDLSFSLKASMPSGLTLSANYHMFELDEAVDDWLNVVGVATVNPVYGPGVGTYKETEAGTELDLKVAYKPASIKGLTLALNYSTFDPGDAVEERNGGAADKADFSYFLMAYAF